MPKFAKFPNPGMPTGWGGSQCPNVSEAQPVPHPSELISELYLLGTGTAQGPEAGDGEGLWSWFYSLGLRMINQEPQDLGRPKASSGNSYFPSRPRPVLTP